MPTRHYTLTLLDDVCVSSTAATTGDRGSLQHVPGSMLLGAAVHRTNLFNLDRGRANRLFHEGGVRFGQARPLSGVGMPAYRAPLSMHAVKGETAETLWYNRAAGGGDDGRQQQQVRGTWVTIEPGTQGGPPALRVHEVATRYTMRTSITPATSGVREGGRPRDGLLFGIDTLAAHQQFVCTIEANDEADLALVSNALATREPIRVGRSRSAEFGRAAVSPRAEAVAEPASGPLIGATEVVIWCLTDVQIRDTETGELTATPCAADFGLPASCEPVRGRWFVRTRRYSGWNTHRRRPTCERWVIEAGSVFVFRNDVPLDDAAAKRVEARLQDGVGELLGEGLGRVCFNHPVLLAPVVRRVDAVDKRALPSRLAGGAKPVVYPAGGLGTWLAQQDRERADRRSLHDQLDAWVTALVAYGDVSASQWGELRAKAQSWRHKAPDSAISTAVDESIKAPSRRERQHEPPGNNPQNHVRPASQDWQARGVRAKKWSTRVGGVTAVDALVSRLREFEKGRPDTDRRRVAQALEMLCSRMVRVVRQRERSSNGGS
jgi:hypothetical protein